MQALTGGHFKIALRIVAGRLVLHFPQILVRMFDDPRLPDHLPRPFGVFYETDRPCYEDGMQMQIEEVMAKGKGNLDKLLRGKETWTIA